MNKKLDQRGAVAILSVVIFATIITVLILAYLRSAVTQQQESLTNDFSNRAFYTAESGVQDTIRAIRADPTRLATKSTCKPFGDDGNIGSANFYLSYTCQTLNAEPKILTGDTVPNEKSAVIRIQPGVASDGYKLVLRWSSQYDPEHPTQKLYHRGSNSSEFTPDIKWLSSANPDKPIHAVLRASVVTHPAAGPFSRAEITQQVVFLNPSLAPSGAVDFTANTVENQQIQLINNAECYDSDNVTGTDMGKFSCKQTIDISNVDFSSKAVYVRISSIYKPTNFSVELRNTSGPVPLLNSQASIDITAKAGGDTYRRVRQTVPLSGYQVKYDNDAALIVGEGICKLFTVTNDVQSYTEGCQP